MSKQITPALQKEIDYCLKLIRVTEVHPFNIGLKPIKDKVMRTLLGQPQEPLPHDDCLQSYASPLVKQFKKQWM